MWVCSYCETNNTDGDPVCVCCGKAKKEKLSKKRISFRRKGKNEKAAFIEKMTSLGKRQKLLLGLCVLVSLLIVLMITGFFSVHFWTPATCTEPETCTLCGKTRGSPAGHKWNDATCTEAAFCSVCGAKKGEPAGHKWRDATCTEPETCSVCGVTRGIAKGHFWRAAT